MMTMIREYTYAAARRLGADEAGATATEYVFLLAFIALVIIGGATLLGQNLDAEFNDAASQVGSA